MPILGITLPDVRNANWNLLMGASCYLAAHVVARTIVFLGDRYFARQRNAEIVRQRSVVSVMAICANVVTHELLKSRVQLAPVNSAMKKVLGVEAAVLGLFGGLSLGSFEFALIPVAGFLDNKRAVKVWVTLGAFSGTVWTSLNSKSTNLED